MIPSKLFLFNLNLPNIMYPIDGEIKTKEEEKKLCGN